MTKSNFQDAISSNEFILVEFYAPWCGHCKQLAPEYAKAATKLKEMGSKIKLAKVDATQESELAESHNVRGYPTLKFFRSGNPIDYTGGRQAELIVSWLEKKTGPPAKSLASAAEITEFVDAASGVAVIGFFEDEGSDEAKHYASVASAFDDGAFGIASAPEALKEYNVNKAKVIVFKKKFEEPNAEVETIEDPNQLRDFILKESLPVIVEFNHENAQKVFGGAMKSHLLLFLSKKEGHVEQFIPPLKDLARRFRDNLLFVLIDVDEPDHSRILDYFGIKDKFPNMRIIRLEEEMMKFKPETPENDFAPENIEKFVQSYIDGKLKKHLLSQDLPEDWDAKPVKVLVHSNFDQIAFDKSKDVLVEFYAPWCSHCKQLAPIYDKLGEAYASRDDIVIAKIDATANELEHTTIVNYPTIKLFKKESNEVVDYNGERTLEGLTKFIESGGVEGQGPPDVKEEEEEEDLPQKDEL